MPITRPVFCAYCLSKRHMKNNPNVAVKYCVDCFDRTKKYFCLVCDEEFHRVGPPKSHLRRLLVIGTGVRKKVIGRGDGVYFPLPMDLVRCKVQCRVFHEGKMIKKEKPTYIDFMAGLSGKCVHVQVLGCKNIMAADYGGASDPYVVAVFQGKTLGMTRVRPRTLNPRWVNETFICPLADGLPDARNMPRSQKGLFRLELYDYDWFGANDFLGNVEMGKDKLHKLAVASKQQPILLPFTMKEFHGLLGVQIGISEYHCAIKVTRAESLDKFNAFSDGRPFVKVYFGDEYLGQTPFAWDTGSVEWTQMNEFRLRINVILKREKAILKKRKAIEAQIKRKIQEKLDAKKAKKAAAAQAKIDHQLAKEKRETDKIAEEEAKIKEAEYLTYAQKLEQKKQKKIDKAEAAVKAEEDAVEQARMDEEAKHAEDDPVDIIEEVDESDTNDTLFRFEIFEYNFISPHGLLGEVVFPVDDLRKLCPQFPRRLIEEREPTPEDRVLEGQRRLLNMKGGITSLCCGDKQEDLDDEDDGEDDFWENTFPEPSIMELSAAADDDDDDDPFMSNSGSRGKSDKELLAESKKAQKTELTIENLKNSDRVVEELGIAGIDDIDGIDQESHQDVIGVIKGEDAFDNESSIANMDGTIGQNSLSQLIGEGSLEATTNNGSIVSNVISESGENFLQPPNEQNFLLLDNGITANGDNNLNNLLEGGDENFMGPSSEQKTETEELSNTMKKTVVISASSSGQGNSQEYIDDQTPHENAHLEYYEHVEGAVNYGVELNTDTGAVDEIKVDSQLPFYWRKEESKKAQENVFEISAVFNVLDEITDEVTVRNMEKDYRKRRLSHMKRGELENGAFPEDSLVGQGYINPGYADMEDGYIDNPEEENPDLHVVDGFAEDLDGDGYELVGDNLSGDGNSAKSTSNSVGSVKAKQMGTNGNGSNGVTEEKKEDGDGSAKGTDADDESGGGVGLAENSLVNTITSESVFNPDALVYRKLRHYEVHKVSDKADVDEDQHLGHIILRLIPAKRGNIISGLDEGVRHMSLGETANIKIRYDHAYNNYFMTENIPARANMILTVQLKSINGFGLAGLPLRTAKRIYRFTTFACRKTNDLIRYIAKDARKKKRMKRLWTYLSTLFNKNDEDEYDFDEEEDLIRDVEEYRSDAESEDDSEDEVKEVVKASGNMRKHINPAVISGASYLFTHRKNPPKIKKRKKQNYQNTEVAIQEEESQVEDHQEQEQETKKFNPKAPIGAPPGMETDAPEESMYADQKISKKDNSKSGKPGPPSGGRPGPPS